jgi:hypothetical protein
MAGNRLAVLLAFLFLASAGFAQQNEVAVSFGVSLSPSVGVPALCAAENEVGMLESKRMP